MESCAILLRHGADPNIKNSKEETPLDLAALYGRVETVKVLLQSHLELVGPFTAYGGAIYNHTPLHLASRNGHRYENCTSYIYLPCMKIANYGFLKFPVVYRVTLH